MTKEELEEYENKIVMQKKSKLQKEAENYLNQNCERWESDSLCVDDIAIENYLAGAEPREKHITELKKQLDLKEKALSKAKKETKRIADRVNKDKRRLIRRKAELEAQIEKMKCCENCANYMISGKCPRFFRTGWCKNWEMTRSKK